MKCPICKGKGVVSEPRNSDESKKKRRQAMAITLRKAGFSYGEIKEMCGYPARSGVFASIKRYVDHSDGRGERIP